MKLIIQTEQVEYLLEKYFAEYKEYHIYAIIALIVIIVVFQIVQTMMVTRKLERFKNQLKRSEIKFSKFNNLQIDALKSIYDKMVDFHYINYSIFNPNTFTHEALKSGISKWESDYTMLIDIFHREKLLLPRGLKNKIKEFQTNFSIISKRLNEETQNLYEIEEDFGTEGVQEIYISPENEVDSIKTRVERLNQMPEIQKSDKMIKGLRKNVETYFENLTN